MLARHRLWKRTNAPHTKSFGRRGQRDEIKRRFFVRMRGAQGADDLVNTGDGNDCFETDFRGTLKLAGFADGWVRSLFAEERAFTFGLETA